MRMPDASRAWFMRSAALIAVLIVALSLIDYLPIVPRQAEIAFERANLYLHPSGALAYAYGERHFNAQRPQQYDYVAAVRFFNAALKLDPSLPYVYHQLARAAFLRGDLDQAISLINIQILMHGTSSPSSFYVRGLIEGYRGEYDAAADDYAHFLGMHPDNWAAVNDYAWVLLKGNKPQQALQAIDRVLAQFPDNPWLLNSRAIALYELHRYEEGLAAALHAQRSVSDVAENDWLKAYPGNDPAVARAGVDTLVHSIADTVHRLQDARNKGALQ